MSYDAIEKLKNGEFVENVDGPQKRIEMNKIWKEYCENVNSGDRE